MRKPASKSLTFSHIHHGAPGGSRITMPLRKYPAWLSPSSGGIKLSSTASVGVRSARLAPVGYEYSGATPATHGIVGLPRQKPDNTGILDDVPYEAYGIPVPMAVNPVLAIGAFAFTYAAGG